MTQLIKKILWTSMLIIIFEFGNKILLPGFKFRDYSSVLSQNQYLNLLSGTFGVKVTIPMLFSLGMGPYMTSLIVWQVITMLNEDKFKKLSQQKTSVWQKIITFLIACVQALSLGLLFMRYKPDTNFYGVIGIYWGTVVVLITGSMLVSWLADINAMKGIGGTSVLILPGIVENLPTILNSGLKTPIKMTPFITLVIGVVIFLFVYLSVIINRAELRIPVERINVISRLTKSYIPLKVLSAGAMPFMFALSLYSIPLLITSQFKTSNEIRRIVTNLFSYNTVTGIIVYGLLICILGYGFSFVNIRPHEIAKSLQRSGDYIVGIVIGDQTEKYIVMKLKRVIFVGNLYLLILSVLPLVIGLWIPVVTNFSFFFGTLLILITMIDNVLQEIKALYLKNQYNIFN